MLSRFNINFTCYFLLRLLQGTRFGPCDLRGCVVVAAVVTIKVFVDLHDVIANSLRPPNVVVSAQSFVPDDKKLK